MNITVIIPTKNRSKDLVIAVKSIVNQKLSPNQLIIVDQSDTPQSKEVIQELIERLNPAIKLTYIYDKLINGLVHAKKVGVLHSEGDIIFFLEDDIELESEYISEISAAFKNCKDMMGCCGVVTNLDQISYFYIAFFHLFHRGIFYDARVGIHGFVNNNLATLIKSNYLSGGTSAFRAEVFSKVEFDTVNNFFMLEDIDFSMRASYVYGNHFYINTKARLAHHMSPLNRSVYQYRYQRKLREFIVFYKKHQSGLADYFAMLWLLTGMLIESAIVSVKSRKIGPLKGYFKGLVDGIKWQVV